MSVSDVYLWVSVFGALWTIQALVGLRTPYAFSIFYFLSGWLTTALARQHVLWQAAATVVFVAFGALEEPSGRVGLAVTLASWVGLLWAGRRDLRARDVLARALREDLGVDLRSERPGQRPLETGLRANPFKREDPAIEVVRDLAYGPEGERNRLDIYRPAGRSEDAAPAPVLFWVHGGAWVSGSKEQQGMPLIHTAVRRGWVCVSINYRLSPAATFPEHLIDCKRALVWVREQIGEYGGDPTKVLVVGGSAGAHLASLMAFSPNEPEYQPGFEQADTRVDACVALYGNFDFVNRFGRRNRISDMVRSLEKGVMKLSRDEHPEAWEKASPVCRVSPEAPPFFVLHGTHDALLFVEETRDFVRELRAVSKEPVVYAEIPGAQHGYDIFFTPLARDSAMAILSFGEHVLGVGEDAAAETERATTTA